MVTWCDRLHNSRRLGCVVIASQGSASSVVSLPTRWVLLRWLVCWRSPQRQWRTGSGKYILNACPGMHVFDEYLYQQLFINPLYRYQCSMRYQLIEAEWRIYDHLTIIGSDNGLSPGRRQSIIWNNVGILLIETLKMKFSGILIKIQIFSFEKIHLNIPFGEYITCLLSGSH